MTISFPFDVGAQSLRACYVSPGRPSNDGRDTQPCTSDFHPSGTEVHHDDLPSSLVGSPSGPLVPVLAGFRTTSLPILSSSAISAAMSDSVSVVTGAAAAAPPATGGAMAGGAWPTSFGVST